MSHSRHADFYAVIEQYHDVVRRFIAMTTKSNWLAEDLTQETFIKALQKSDTLQDNAKIRSWLMRIAYHVCLDHFRREAGRRAEPLADIEEVLAAPGPSPGKEMERREMSLCVQQKMLLLPLPYRTILSLDGAGLSQADMAAVLGIGVDNVKVRLHRARKRLREILLQQCTFNNDERAVLVCVPREESRTSPSLSCCSC